MATEREWPRARPSNGTETSSPRGFYQSRDGVLRSDQPLAGPLRTGTSSDVGPRDRARGAGGESDSSDFGMDRISPRGFDPMGTALDRYGPQRASDLVTTKLRRRGD